MCVQIAATTHGPQGTFQDQSLEELSNIQNTGMMVGFVKALEGNRGGTVGMVCQIMTCPHLSANPIHSNEL